MRLSSIILYRSLIILSCLFSAVLHAQQDRVAVTVYAQNAGAESQLRTAQSRLESILLDNGYTVMDERETEKLKNSWTELEDPSYLITAEDIINRAEKFKIDKIVRVYLTVDQAETFAGYFSASAILNIRVVDKSAKVQAYTSKPMGTPGLPMSDGLTAQAAKTNAVQRAIDISSTNIGLEVISVATPRALSFMLSDPQSPDGQLLESVQWFNAVSDPKPYPLPLIKEGWKNESLTCQARDPANVYLVAGGYIKSTSGGHRTYSSLLHIVDLADNKEVLTFEPNSDEKFQNKRKLGTTKILSCFFINSWRYVAALTGDYLILYDTERGIEMSARRLPKGIKKGNLGLVAGDLNNINLIVQSKKNQWAFRIDRKR